VNAPIAAEASAGLKRGMGFFPALTSNMLNMVGIGPFVTIPLILGAMGGPQALLGWICGAIIALSDGLAWAELGAAMPDTGGSYEYLQKAFEPLGIGRLMGFLFLWQVMLAAPLTAASGGVGFADYTRYLIPSLSPWEAKLVAMGVCLFATFLLYRDIKSIGKISNVLWAGLMLAIGIILWGGARHFSPAVAFNFPPHAFALSPAFFNGLGAAALLSMYDYSGYFNVCLIGGEVRNPTRTIPRVVVLSIVILAVLYVAMSLSIIGVVPWREAVKSTSIVSDYMERLYGAHAAALMTLLVLWVAFASVFCVLLGYTRVPYAAAVEGHFFKSFGRLHPTRNFPAFSVLFFGAASVLMCFFPLDALIKELLVIQIVTWFAAQCVGVVLIRRLRQDIVRPFRMPLYPLPVMIALLGWLFIFGTSGWPYIVSALALVVVGVIAFRVFTRP
jgi:amino acid transporter